MKLQLCLLFSERKSSEPLIHNSDGSSLSSSLIYCTLPMPVSIFLVGFMMKRKCFTIFYIFILHCVPKPYGLDTSVNKNVFFPSKAVAPPPTSLPVRSLDSGSIIVNKRRLESLQHILPVVEAVPSSTSEDSKPRYGGSSPCILFCLW